MTSPFLNGFWVIRPRPMSRYVTQMIRLTSVRPHGAKSHFANLRCSRHCSCTPRWDWRAQFEVFGRFLLLGSPKALYEAWIWFFALPWIFTRVPPSSEFMVKKLAQSVSGFTLTRNTSAMASTWVEKRSVLSVCNRLVTRFVKLAVLPIELYNRLEPCC